MNFSQATNAIYISTVAVWRLHCILSSTAMSHFQLCREIKWCLLDALLDYPRRRTNGRRALVPDPLRYGSKELRKARALKGRNKYCQSSSRIVSVKCR